MRHKQNLLPLLLAFMLLASCMDEKIQQMKFEDLTLSDTKATVEVEYYTASGELVSDASQIKPDTEYILKITSDYPVGLKFRKTDGFTFLNGEQDMFSLSTNKSYNIKTNSQDVGDLFFSAYPILKNDSGDFMKERPQLFLKSF